MSSIPTTLTEATEQAKAAVQAALKDGIRLLQVEMAIPEIKHQPIAEQFLEIFQDFQQLKVFFPDAGAAALARRDWGNPDFTIRGLGELTQPVEADDDIYLVVNPSAIEVAAVESLCNDAGDRPVVLLNPKLEDVAIVGIGYAGRQLRDRFLSQIQISYYLRPLDQAALYRCYPGPWQLWRETAPDTYEWASDFLQRPSGEEIDRILYAEGTISDAANAAIAAASSESLSQSQPAESKTIRKKGFLTELQQFLRALSQ
jgi:hypothetical protein